MKKIKIFLYLLALVCLISLFWPREKVALEVVKVAEAEKPKPTHQQQVWISVLEWCESKGVTTAVNKVDRDGTPSYYSFQFKPGTFRYYGELYGVIPVGLTEAELMEKLKSYELQHSIVEQMVLNRDKIQWTKQFPDCVKKYGLPPR